MRNIILVLFLVVSVNSYSYSLDDIIKKYGKDAVISKLQTQTTKGLTVYVNEAYKQVNMPNSDYVTTSTLAYDLDRLGLSTSDLETLLKKKPVNTKQISTEEYNRLLRLHHEESSRRQAQEEAAQRRAQAYRVASRTNMSSAISNRCTKKWGNNYRMVKYCVEQQLTALQHLQNTGVYR